MDNFGFTTQGKNYSLFRPKYPQCLYLYTINKLKHKNRYLDIAMGTGQLFFKIAPLFKQSLGTDISQKMLQTSLNILKTQYPLLIQNSRIQKCDVMDLNTDNKYDLITIGQALHWFKVRQALIRIKRILQPNGRLLVLSYIVKGAQQQLQNKRYSQFYEKVKPLFDFDRNQLENKYNNLQKYPFEQIFPTVIRYSQQVRVSMLKNQYINYLKTYSGYNQYLLKHLDQQDPLKCIQKECSDKVTVIIEFFKIQCGL